jgi:predicted GNAT family acetyltransferase
MSLATQTCLESGKIPYYYASSGNPSAMKLAQGLGYYIYQEAISGKGMKK